MPFAAAVKFKENGASKYFHPAGLDLERDDFVWVKDPGSGGIERIGFVSCMEGRAAIQMNHLPRVLRHAEDEEIEQWYELKVEEHEMLQVTRERAEAHELPIKVSDLIFVPDKRQVQVQFTSDHRIDFRDLVRDLAGHFKARIEMWQIGARKEAGLKDGYGVCGNPLCCGSWLKDFPSITMRYAKEQDIIQPPSKLSGPCGKLRCCLRYEHETYLELADGVATRGCTGCSSDGKCGVVVDRNLIKQELTLKTDEGSYVAVPVGEFVEDGVEGKSGREIPRISETKEATPPFQSREEPRRWGPGEPPENRGDGSVAHESGVSVEQPPSPANPRPGSSSGDPRRTERERKEGPDRRERGGRRSSRRGRGRGRPERRRPEPGTEAPSGGSPPAASGRAPASFRERPRRPEKTPDASQDPSRGDESSAPREGGRRRSRGRGRRRRGPGPKGSGGES